MITSAYLGTRVETLSTLNKFTKLGLVVTKKKSFVSKHDKKKNFLYINKTNKKKIFKLLIKKKFDLVYSSGFPYLIDKNTILKSKSIFINSHPSLLPKYKGFSPIKSAIRNKENYSGITLHFINDIYDSGKIILQKKIRIKGLNIKKIYEIFFTKIEIDLLISFLKKFAKNKKNFQKLKQLWKKEIKKI